MKLCLPDHRRGSVLIIVLWIAFGLVAMALYFANSMSSELRASDNRVELLAADQAIEGASRYVAKVLAEQATNGLVPYLNDYAKEAVAVGDAHFWLIGRTDGQAAPTDVAYGLVDEGSKLNINNTNVTAEMLELLPRMTPELAAAIVDWRDANEDLTSGGAEADTYARLRPAYYCKNAPFDSLGELKLVNGATVEILIGDDLNRNGVLDPNESSANRSGVSNPGILEYLTVSSAEPNTRADGSARVNVNTRPALESLISDALGASVATRVRNNLGNRPPFGSILEFYQASGMTASEFASIETEITTTTGPTISGRVNVNTASAVVLTCIPGIGDDKAAELVNYRLSNSSAVDTVAWVTQVLTSTDQIRQAGPFLTGQSYQFSADIAAIGKFGRGYRRTRFVFDTTEGTPKIIYRQSLSHLGWALGKETRQVWLATAKP